MDKTPAYSLILDFMARIYPRAKYVILTRHPLAVFSSYAESFFDSDYQAAQDYNPILERYVPAIAKFLREAKTPIYHVVYEKMVADPEAMLAEIFAFLGLEHEPQAVNYGEFEHEEKGLGDPIGVAKHSRPTTASIEKWAIEIASVPQRLAAVPRHRRAISIRRISRCGGTRWRASGRRSIARAPPATTPVKKKLDRYRLQRKAIVKLRATVQRSPALRKLLTRFRLGADVLLRE